MYYEFYFTELTLESSYVGEGDHIRDRQRQEAGGVPGHPRHSVPSLAGLQGCGPPGVPGKPRGGCQGKVPGSCQVGAGLGGAEMNIS